MTRKEHDGLSVKGFLTANFYDAKTKKLVETRYLGQNLTTNNSKAVMTHLLAQVSSTGNGNLSNVVGFDPRVFINVGSGISGGVNIDKTSFSPTAINLQLAYMGFGTNSIAGDSGVSTDVDQYGLYNIVDKNGIPVAENTNASLTVSEYFYGGSNTVHQYLQSATGNVDDATLRIITRIGTTEGQPAGGTIEYKEAGLFTTLFYDSSVNGSTQAIPLMFARKTFATITKTSDLEIEFVWEIRI